MYGCQPKNRGVYPPKMDGENFMENPSLNMGWFGGKFNTPLYLEVDTHISLQEVFYNRIFSKS